MEVWDKRDTDLTGELGLLHSAPCKSVSVGLEYPTEPGGSSKPVSLQDLFCTNVAAMLMCENMSSVQ